MLDERRKTRVVEIGKVKIGGDNGIAIQSMCNTPTRDVKKTVEQILKLEDAGCDIIRVAVPDKESVSALPKIKEQINIPIIADIHFDHRLAIECADTADKIRINPGNIGGHDRFKEVIRAAKENGIPLRIGVNLGSLEKDIEERSGRTPEAIVESAARAIKVAEELGFKDLVISLKSSSVADTICAYRIFSKRFDHPLHIGVTEAGPLPIGAVKSSVGIGTLLAEGIGDTIRVSLTEDPVEEVCIAKEILRSLNFRKGRIFVSCPTCARTNPQIISFAKEIEEKTRKIDNPMKIAVMGCEVNGPGEAKDADIGIAFSRDRAFLFRKGRMIRSVEQEDAVKAVLTELKDLLR